jgi:hypothetical protein
MRKRQRYRKAGSWTLPHPHLVFRTQVEGVNLALCLLVQPPITCSIAQPKSTSKSNVRNIESAVGEVPEQEAKAGPKRNERIPDPPPCATQMKAGALIVKGRLGGATTKDSSPYSLDGAVDGLLEVGGAMAGRSPKRHKKTTNTSMDQAAVVQGEDAPPKVRNKARRGIRGFPSAQDRKLIVFNIHGTLLDSSFIVDKNPNTAI